MSQDEKAERIKKAQVAYQSGVISEVEYKELVRKIKAGEMPSRRYSDKSESLSRIEHLTQLATGEDMSEKWDKKFIKVDRSVHGANKNHTRYSLSVGNRSFTASTNAGPQKKGLIFQYKKKTPLSKEMGGGYDEVVRKATVGHDKKKGWQYGHIATKTRFANRRVKTLSKNQPKDSNAKPRAFRKRVKLAHNLLGAKKGNAY